LQIGTVAFLPGARCAEVLQGTQPEHKNKPSEMKPEIIQLQSWRYKTIVVIKHQQQTTISKKKFKTSASHMKQNSNCEVLLPHKMCGIINN